MRLKFTKMQGAGNDFVVLDGVRQNIELSAAQYRWLAHRQFGIGADQILLVEPPSPDDAVDFRYRIINADGGEVEHCGNGARCFMRFVRETGLSIKDEVRVRTLSGISILSIQTDGRIRVEMGRPEFDESNVPFDASGLESVRQGVARLWPLTLHDSDTPVWIQAISMGNPHAVQFVDDVRHAPVRQQGPLIERHGRFPRRVNAGFVQVLSRRLAWVRVFERGAGETLACGTGVCAAVVSGIQRGLFDSIVDVQTWGGRLTIEWNFVADADAPVLMSGPAQAVFASEVDVPSTEQALAVLSP